MVRSAAFFSSAALESLGMFQSFSPEGFIDAAQIDEVEGAQRSQGVELVTNALQNCAGNWLRAEETDVDIRATIGDIRRLGTEDEHLVPHEMEKHPDRLANGRTERVACRSMVALISAGIRFHAAWFASRLNPDHMWLVMLTYFMTS